MQIAKHGEQRRRRIGHVGAHRVAGAARVLGRGRQVDVAGLRIATVDLDPSAQPARVGGADRLVVALEHHQGLVGQRARGIELAGQPFGFAFDQREAGFDQGTLRFAHGREQAGGIGGKRARPSRIALTQVPGQRDDKLQAQGALQGRQIGFPLRQLRICCKHVNHSKSLVNTASRRKPGSIISQTGSAMSSTFISLVQQRPKS